MLGMMNCPTESVEFYSASPALKRVIAGQKRGGSDDTSTTASSSTSADDEHQITVIDNTATKCDDAAKQSTASGTTMDVDEEVDDEEDVVRVFTEARHRPQVTYTTDGRKLLNGKLYSIDIDASTAIDPLKMWDRLIMSSMAAKLNQQHEQKPSRRWSVTTATGDATSMVAKAESKLSTNERILLDKTSTKMHRRNTHQNGATPEKLLVDDLSINVTKISCASL